MTTPPPPDNTVLALYPPKVNGQTEPVTGADIGVPLVAYDLVTDGEGAYVLVDPPSAGTLNPGDVIELWLKGETAILDSQTILDPNAITTLRIPKGRLHPDRVNELYYSIKRGSSNIGTSEPPLGMLYNRIRPGLKDRLTNPSGHSELALLLPEEIKNGVGAGFVSAEVCVAYPYCRAYDRISLKCNGELLSANVNPNEAPQPPNPGSEEPITICFIVDRAFLERAKRLDQKLHFSYTVTDQIGNGPDTDAPWSPVQTVDEDLDGTLLPMPILLERMEDFPGDDASIIDLEKLNGNPLLVIVVTADTRFVVGYGVVATFTAKVTGQPDVVVTVSGKVEADPFGQKKTCILEVPNDKVIPGSAVTVTYDVSKPAGDQVGTSAPAHAQVTGTRLVLKAPSIKEADGNSLAPVAAKDTLTAVVPAYANMIGTQLRVTWAGTAGAGSHTTELVTVTTQAPQNIALDNKVVAFNLNLPVTVTYEMIRNGGAPKESESLTLAVQRIADGDAQLPTPAIDGAVGNELDVNELEDQARTRVTGWPFIAQGQTLWLRYFGTKEDGSPFSHETYAGTVIPADGVPGGLLPLAPVDGLRELEDGSELQVEFKVGFTGSLNEQDVVTFPSRRYTIMATPKLMIDTYPMILDGHQVTLDDPLRKIQRYADPIGTVERRQAQGGTPPYRYHSSKPDIATVDEKGTVRSVGNGKAIVTVIDAKNSEASFEVIASNVYQCILSSQIFSSRTEILAWIESVGGGLESLPIPPIPWFNYLQVFSNLPYLGYTEYFYTGRTNATGGGLTNVICGGHGTYNFGWYHSYSAPESFPFRAIALRKNS
ncbi:hypothetical protein PS718_03436 [Pseudomonas fluorescens]|uniref:Uncharacterized protein n=1 Tax=Pseudomonas fluorescens TaxID=294 RepID=A0A5E7D163_PSEFL|nr:Ig-like domain-containing protein [Pseudomonas fluorescens]VVO11047.1 hypothetical protein PS718_03436 [Pseudomonas fluorescens]